MYAYVLAVDYGGYDGGSIDEAVFSTPRAAYEYIKASRPADSNHHWELTRWNVDSGENDGVEVFRWSIKRKPTIQEFMEQVERRALQADQQLLV